MHPSPKVNSKWKSKLTIFLLVNGPTWVRHRASSQDQAIQKLASSCIELENGKFMFRRWLVISKYLCCAQFQNVPKKLINWISSICLNIVQYLPSTNKQVPTPLQKLTFYQSGTWIRQCCFSSISARTHQRGIARRWHTTIFLQREWNEYFEVDFAVVLHIWSCAPLSLLVISQPAPHLVAGDGLQL
jgi:hypothetical protein